MKVPESSRGHRRTMSFCPKWENVKRVRRAVFVRVLPGYEQVRRVGQCRTDSVSLRIRRVVPGLESFLFHLCPTQMESGCHKVRFNKFSCLFLQRKAAMFCRGSPAAPPSLFRFCKSYSAGQNMLQYSWNAAVHGFLSFSDVVLRR